ncbi:MAG: glycosyltransferase [Gemmatimonadales bacterium]
MKTAIVHDWLVVYAGAERVLEQMLRVLPEAELFSLIDFLPESERAFLGGRKARTSFLQRLPGARTRYRRYLPLMPLAIEQLDLAGYDLVISSSYAVAKGVLTGPDQLHLCMCYSPMRYVWDLQHQYLRETGLDRGVLGAIARYVLHRVRNWDARTGAGVDGFIAISHFVARRIQKAYRRESTVIYPPVDVETFTPATSGRESFYLTASRLVPYKRLDVVVDAFAGMPDRTLIVIGDGPEAPRLKGRAPPNVRFLGHQPLEVLRDHMQRAAAFIFAAEEDFGIVPLEAQACGCPVIAYGKGGAMETIRGLDHAQPSGVLFEEQTPDSLHEAMMVFERRRTSLTPANCRDNAMRFAPERFRCEFERYVRDQVSRFQENLKQSRA